MNRLLLSKGVKIVIVSAFIVVLLLAANGCAPAEEVPPAKPAVQVASIVVTPHTITTEELWNLPWGFTVEVCGSGFAPGSIISLGFPDLPVSKEIPEEGLVWGSLRLRGSGLMVLSLMNLALFR